MGKNDKLRKNITEADLIGLVDHLRVETDGREVLQRCQLS